MLIHAPYLPTHVDYRKHFMAWKGPFVIVKEIAPDTFELTGTEAGVPTVYHRSKLRRYLRQPNEELRLSQPPAPLKFIDGKVEYEVGEVLGHREARGKRQYLLQWKGTPETSWEWEANLAGCLDLLRQYLRRIGEEGRVLPPELTSEELPPPPAQDPGRTPGPAPGRGSGSLDSTGQDMESPRRIRRTPRNPTGPLRRSDRLRNR